MIRNTNLLTALMGKEENMANQFIKLTSRSGKPALVNINNVTNIIDNIDDTVIYFTSGMSLDVREDLVTIAQTILGEVEFKAEANTVVTSTNVPSPGRVLLDVQSLIQEEFKYDSDTEKDVKLVNDSVYLIFSKYSSSRLRMAANIRDGKPVLEGTKGNGWAYYARISAGQLIESDGEDVPGTREDKIRNVLNKLFELYK